MGDAHNYDGHLGRQNITEALQRVVIASRKTVRYVVEMVDGVDLACGG